VLGRTGAILAERYHVHVLTSKREVRRALVYVLQNYKKHPDRHLRLFDGVDVASSARWFADWDRPPARTGPPPVSPPRTWLLRLGWQDLGLLSRNEAPAQRRG
jgi:putative transposase